MTRKVPGVMLMLLSAVVLAFISGPGSPAPTKAWAATAATNDEPNQTAVEWFAPDQVEAQKRAQEVVPFVGETMDECKLCRQQRLRDSGLGVKDQLHSYYLLDSPIINKLENHYGPVRFMHAKHAAQIQDCALCHHNRPLDESASETSRCSACHQEPFRKDHPERLGLKAAYHQQCIECHREVDKGPIDCIGCHTKTVPDHSELVKLEGKPEPSQVTAECLRCHKESGEDMLKTAHWLWKGPSPYTMKHRKEVEHGKATTAVNNF